MRVLVVGAGIAGLTVASRLGSRFGDVVLMEPSWLSLVMRRGSDPSWRHGKRVAAALQTGFFRLPSFARGPGIA
jgi:2-polyprenyl-6-methoxyphenol hydroxylase-like FAD-dependent oxidoreductase